MRTEKNQEYIVEQIVEIRRSAKLTQRQLSELSGVNQAQIAKIEQGVNAPTVATLNKIIEPLGYEVRICKK